MAEKRMFAKTIIDSDDFLDMPMSARLLYYDLGMRADDDGFVNSPKKILKITGASVDDLKILIMKQYIIPFDNGVVVIRHWRINNYLRSDRYTQTQYVDLLEQLSKDNKGRYLLKGEDDVIDALPDNEDSGIPDGIPMVYPDKIREEESSKDKKDSKESFCSTSDLVKQAIASWNTLEQYGVSPVKRMSKDSTRYKSLNARIKEYGIEEVIRTIESIKDSDFLLGRVVGRQGKAFFIDIDWFVKPNNFPKVCEGKYLNKKHSMAQNDNSHNEDDYFPFQ